MRAGSVLHHSASMTRDWMMACLARSTYKDRDRSARAVGTTVSASQTAQALTSRARTMRAGSVLAPLGIHDNWLIGLAYSLPGWVNIQGMRQA